MPAPLSFKLSSLKNINIAKSRRVVAAASQFGAPSNVSSGNQFWTGFLGKLLNSFGNIFVKAAKLVWDGVAFLGKAFSVTKIVQFFIQAAVYIYHFDFNISDKEIDNRIKSALLSLSAMAGGLVGQTLGWVVCGVLPAALVVVFNVPLSLKLAKAAGLKKISNAVKLADVVTDVIDEEFVDEIAGSLASLILSAGRMSIEAAFLAFYKNFRAFLKNTKLAEKIFGKEKVKKWGVSGPPVSMARTVEEIIEKIPNEYLRMFVEEFMEEFFEGCGEALLVLAGAMDSWLGLQRSMQSQDSQGQNAVAYIDLAPKSSTSPTKNLGIDETPVMTNTIRRELAPRNHGGQILKVCAPPQSLPVILSSVAANAELLRSKDVGTVFANDIITVAKKIPYNLSIILEYSSFPDGATMRNGVKAKRPTYSIPVDKSKVDWERIKEAAGGSNGYMYGPVKVTYQLEDDDGRYAGQLALYAATEAEARRRLNAFLTLSSLRILSATVTEEKEEGKRQRRYNNVKPRIQVYPAYFTIIYKKRVLNLIGDNQAGGRVQVTTPGRTFNRRVRIPLWMETKPPYVDEQIRELLDYTPGRV